MSSSSPPPLGIGKVLPERLEDIECELADGSPLLVQAKDRAVEACREEATEELFQRASIVIEIINMLGYKFEMPSDWSMNAEGYIVRTLAVAAYLLWAIVSCFIRKRELSLMNGVYDQENRLRAQLGELRREFPLI